MPTASMAELAEKLQEQGVNADPVRVACALLDTVARVHNDPAIAVGWLEELAAEVLKSSTSLPCPILDDLQARLESNGAPANVCRVAAALLGIAHDEQWTRYPNNMVDWLGRIAVETGKSH
jgi:hypothetical protein